ncbi:MAG: DMT family transporter [Pseudomonadota bacterium]
MELWIPFSIAAGFLQNLRSALQKHLTGKLSTNGAAYSRFIFAMPIAIAYVVLLNRAGGYAIPAVSPQFLLYCTLGGISQIMFTVFLLWLFSFKSFAVGTSYSKLEVLMVAILGALLLGDTLSYIGSLAIVLASVGVVALSIGKQAISVNAFLVGFSHRSTWIGLACAVWLGGSVVFFRGAALSLGDVPFLMAAAFALMVSVMIQSALMGVYLVLREPGELTRVFINWRWTGAAGIAGAFASIAWFTAFTLHNASYVRAVGQIELLFTFIASVFFFREKVTATEVAGIVLITVGILLLMIYG